MEEIFVNELSFCKIHPAKTLPQFLKDVNLRGGNEIPCDFDAVCVIGHLLNII
jgi:hypothetical protein